MLNATRPPNSNDPERSFKHPSEIVEATGLTRGEKLHALSCWMLAVQQRLALRRHGARDDERIQRELLEDIRRARELVNVQFKSAREQQQKW
jgi:hypothetical protein